MSPRPICFFLAAFLYDFELSLFIESYSDEPLLLVSDFKSQSLKKVISN